MLFVFVDLKACDICGCSIGGNYFGLLPNYNTSFVGIRYKYNRFNSVHDGENTFGNDYYHSVDIWGAYSPLRKLQIYASMPYNINKRIENDNIIKVNGISDISLMASYNIFDNSRTIGNALKHFIQLGAGVKLPTGKSDIVRDKHTLPAALQLGTGSFDYLLNVIYVMRFQNFGFNLTTTCRFTGYNKMNYKFGNRFSAYPKFYYWWNTNKAITLVPQVGVDINYADADIQNDKLVAFSGSKIASLSLGSDLYYKNYTLGFNIQQPIYQHINDSYTKLKSNFNLQLNYFFNNKTKISNYE